MAKAKKAAAKKHPAPAPKPELKPEPPKQVTVLVPKSQETALRLGETIRLDFSWEDILYTAELKVLSSRPITT